MGSQTELVRTSDLVGMSDSEGGYSQKEKHFTYHRLTRLHQDSGHLYLQQGTTGSGVGLEGEHHLGQERCCGKHTGVSQATGQGKDPARKQWLCQLVLTVSRLLEFGVRPFPFSMLLPAPCKEQRRELSTSQTSVLGWFRLRFPSGNAMVGK